jgi:hypothetical protein
MSEIPLPVLIGAGVLGLCLLVWLKRKLGIVMQEVKMQLFTFPSIVATVIHATLAAGLVALVVGVRVYVIGLPG